MYICMHICTYLCMYAYMYACSHVCMYLQTKTGGKRMMRHDRSRGGSISVASSTVTPWSTGSFPWSPTPVSPSLLFFSYTHIYIGLLPPCLILVFPPSIGLSMLSDARLLLIIHLPFSLSLYATFRSACSSLCFLRTLNRARSLFYLLLTLIVCTNSVSLSLCHSHSLLTVIVAISCIYPCLITMHVADV